MNKVKPIIQTPTSKVQSRSRKDLSKVYLETNKSTSVHSSMKNVNVFVNDSSPKQPRGSPKHDSEKDIMSKYPTSKLELPMISPSKIQRNTGPIKRQHYLHKSENEMYKVCETSPNHSPISPLVPNQARRPMKMQPPKKHLTVFDNSPYHTKKYRTMQNESNEQRNSDKKSSINNFTSCVIALNTMNTLTEADVSSSIGNDNKIHYELSQPGKLIGNNNHKENQDSYMMLDDLFGFDHCSIFGVMDGHGTNGHFVSRFIKQSAIDFFSQLDSYKGKKKTGIVTEAGIYDKLTSKSHQFITSFYVDMEEKLRNGKFDVHYSGSTCIMCFVIDGKLICSNTGDSRAILIKQNDQGLYSTEALSNDHKPNSPKEMSRIKAKGGLVIQDKDCMPQEGIYRVWTKSQDGPGIAISRTIGDEVAASIGVIPDPEIIEKYITNEMCYIVAGSDGIWDFIENDKVMSIVNPYYMKNDPKGAANAVVQEATKLWVKEGGPIDDITCIVYFLRPFKKD